MQKIKFEKDFIQVRENDHVQVRPDQLLLFTLEHLGDAQEQLAMSGEAYDLTFCYEDFHIFCCIAAQDINMDQIVQIVLCQLGNTGGWLSFREHGMRYVCNKNKVKAISEKSTYTQVYFENGKINLSNSYDKHRNPA